MREYKFRAWLKKEKKMVRVLAIDFESETILIKGVPQNTYIHTKEFGEESDYSWICFDDIILMQSTGLKDKNSKEIYEGDIVEYCFDWTWSMFCEEGFTKSKTKIIGIVKILMSGIKIKIIKQEQFDNGDIAEPMINSKYVRFLKKTKDVKVIGNIHENPELLEVK